MKAFLKENSILLAGISLPLLLTLIFFISTQMTRLSVEAPQYSLVYATDYMTYNNRNLYWFKVKDHKLHFVYTPPKDDNNNMSRNMPRLFLYTPQTGENREISVPDIEDRDHDMDVIVPELANISFDNKMTSPDGYIFEKDRDGNGNLMTALFGGGYDSRNRYVLTSKGRKEIIPASNTKPYSYCTEFIGWVEKDEDAQ